MTKKKTTIILISVFVALTVIFGISFAITASSRGERLELLNASMIILKHNGAVVKTLTYDEVKAVGEKDFLAVYKPSGIEPVQKTYTGIEVKDLLLKYSIDISAVISVQFTASDGKSQAYSAKDISTDNNVFIAYLVNKKPFNKTSNSYKTEEQEDGAPYVAIRTSDKFSQYRCKFLVEINILS